MKQTGKYGRYLYALLTLSDMGVINLLFWVATLLCPAIGEHGGMRGVWLALNVAYLPVIVWFDHFHNQRSLTMEHVATSSVQAVCIHALCFVSLLWFLDIDTIPRIGFVIFYALMAVGLPVWWVLTRRAVKIMRSRGRNYVSVVIVGTNRTAKALYQELIGDAGFGYRVVGFFDDEMHGDDGPWNEKDAMLGDFAHISQYLHEHAIDQIYYTLPGTKDDTLLMNSVIRAADDTMTTFFYVPRISRRLRRRYDLETIGLMPVLAQMRNPLTSATNRAIKRAFDVAFSSVALICSPIVFIPIAVAVKLSSKGPVFFVQKRTGYKGQPFDCYKFRTMRVNADADTLQTTQHDPRKTRVGDFLRRTSLDELPQMYNVLRGDMSIVGPRPHMLKDTEEYSRIIDSYMLRHIVKPGITGWAQVNGYRGLTDEPWKMQRRVECDVWYIENWSFFLDLKIVVRTFTRTVSGDPNAF